MGVRDNVSSHMRRTVVLALLIGLPLTAWAVSTTPSKAPTPITHLPTPVAEPENGQSYTSPTPRTGTGPSAADRGPAQKYFVLAWETDNLATQDNPPIANVNPSEKIELDKKIRVPLVHDVQDDDSFKGGDNHSIEYEITYLNWGAITQEQLKARQGDYLTITFVNSGPRSDFTTRLEYRQVKSKEIVRSLIQKKTNVSGAARAYFGVVNKAYLAYGPISAWRFTVLRGDTVVAEAKSFLW